MTNHVKALLNGDRLSLSRILTQVENDTQEGRVALDELFFNTGKAHLIGVTGAPGVGKSSLVNLLAQYYRENKKKSIAIVAVDPTSPFTGGAVLGDRVRMRDLAGDSGVFIRSMATRGNLGGIAHATAAMTQVFDAAGFDLVIIETVGAGQAEVDIARLAHTTLVVEAPGMGDDIQAIKAGILEIADILIINKADHPGIEHTESALRGMLELAHPVRRTFIHHGQAQNIETKIKPEIKESEIWQTSIHKTIATEGTGIPELVQNIEEHVGYLERSGRRLVRDRSRLESELNGLIQDTLSRRFRSSLSSETYEETMRMIVDRKLSPWVPAEKLLNGRKI